MSENTVLSVVRPLEIRFSEVDSMNIVWHGSYALYLEDAREAFGLKYGLKYLDIYGAGYYAPLVEYELKFVRPLLYGMRPEISITYCPTESAKLVFEYEIKDTETGQTMATGRTVQVFMDMDRQLVWTNPPFFEDWKRKWRQ